jgi:hypothetical protein
MRSKVLIRGEGVAASCCISLLDRAGSTVIREVGPRPKLPAIMVSESTQQLITSVFELPDLFCGLPQIRRRIVRWGLDAPTLTLPHAAIVVSEQVLLDRISAQPTLREPAAGGESLWTILASRPLPEPSQEYQFGSRMASASKVERKEHGENDSSWVESLPNGWLFLLPNGETSWLLSVGDSTEALLAESRAVAPQVARFATVGGSFACHPRIAEPLCGSDWLACGSAALGFDPLCGDGSGNAVREGVLASAVARAVAAGEDVNAVTAHYRARLLAGFYKHLDACHQFYRAGRAGPWWDEQIDATQRGLTWCQSRLEGVTGFRYRLNGFVLEPLS